MTSKRAGNGKDNGDCNGDGDCNGNCDCNCNDKSEMRGSLLRSGRHSVWLSLGAGGAALADGGGQLAEGVDGFGPAEAGVGDGLAVDQ
jgi:hypothetical protein